MRNVGPLLGTVPLHQRQHELVLILRPGALDELRIQHFLPTMEALDVSAALQTLRNLLPVLAIVLSNGAGQLFIFLWRPVALVRPILILCRTRFVDAWVIILPSDDHLLCGLEKFFVARARAKEPRHKWRIILIVWHQASLTVARNIVDGGYTLAISHLLILIHTSPVAIQLTIRDSTFLLSGGALAILIL